MAHINIMEQKMFDEFFSEFADEKNSMRPTMRNIYGQVEVYGKNCYLAGLRDGQAIAQQKGGHPQEELSATNKQQS